MQGEAVGVGKYCEFSFPRYITNGTNIHSSIDDVVGVLEHSLQLTVFSMSCRIMLAIQGGLLIPFYPLIMTPCHAL